MSRPNYGTRVRINDPESRFHDKEGTVRLLGPGSYDLDVKVRLDPGDSHAQDVWFAAESLIVVKEAR